MAQDSGIVKDALGSVVNNSTNNYTLEEKVYESEISKDITFLVFNDSYAVPLKKSHPENTIIILKGGKEFDIEFNYASISGVVYMQKTHKEKLQSIVTELKKNGCIVSIIALHKDGGIAECEEYVDPVEVITSKTESENTKVEDTKIDPTKEFCHFYTLDELCTEPPLDYWVEDVAPKGGVVTIFGASSSGKTFLTLDMVFAVLRGVDTWMGKEVKQTNVLYICLEGQSGFTNRIKAFRKTYPEISGGELIVVKENLDFTTDTHIDILIEKIKNYKHKFGIIIVDTLAQAAPSIDGNSSLIAAVVHRIKRLGSGDGTIIIIDHTGKDVSKGIIGHSSKRAGVDIAIEVSVSNKEHSARIEKNKDGEEGHLANFYLVPVIIQEADPSIPKSKTRVSCVVKEVGAAPVIVLTNKKDKLLQAISLNENKNYKALQLITKDYIKGTYLSTLLNELVDENKIIKEGVGKKSSEHTMYKLTNLGSKYLFSRLHNPSKSEKEALEQCLKQVKEEQELTEAL